MIAAQLDELFETAVDTGASPGGAAAVWRGGQLRWRGVFGRLEPGGATVEADTLYDLASLTKVLSTTTLVAQALDAGVMGLDERLPAALAVTGGGAPLRPRLVELLEHAAGLEAHREFFHAPWSLGPGQREELLAAVRGVAPACAPNERAIYTDLGFLLLGAWLERRLGAGLDALFEARVAAPLGLSGQIGFRPLTSSLGLGLGPGLASVAPTEVYERGEPQHWWPIRERVGQGVARGVVHDDNCVVMGGVAGHAGLFGTLGAVLEIGRAWLEARLPGVEASRCSALVQRFFTRSAVAGSTRALGFDGVSTDHPSGGSTGGALSPGAVGHLGFTGTSLWIDPDPAVPSVYALLTNRVHPSRADTRIRQLRPAFHRLAARL